MDEWKAYEVKTRRSWLILLGITLLVIAGTVWFKLGSSPRGKYRESGTENWIDFKPDGAAVVFQNGRTVVCNWKREKVDRLYQEVDEWRTKYLDQKLQNLEITEKARLAIDDGTARADMAMNSIHTRVEMELAGNSGMAFALGKKQNSAREVIVVRDGYDLKWVFVESEGILESPLGVFLQE